LDVIALMGQEGNDAKEQILAHWPNTKTNNIVIDDLIEDIMDRGTMDKGFMQKEILVLIDISIVHILPRLFQSLCMHS
jgi:hypothetical protein